MGKLTDSTRRLLVNIVVAYITDKEGRVPSKETKTRCALGIVTLFPALKDPYSKTGYEHFYDPKSNQGYTSWRLKTVSRQSKPHSTRNARSSATSDDEGSGGPTAHLEKQLEGDQCKEAISFMNHCTEKDQIFEKMKLTFKHRQQLIHDAIKSNTVFSVFPRFLDTKGLVLQDFDIKFGTETASRLLEQWDSLKPKVIAEAKTLTSTCISTACLQLLRPMDKTRNMNGKGGTVTCPLFYSWLSFCHLQLVVETNPQRSASGRQWTILCSFTSLAAV
ncbi:uncharacterized protein LOC125244240 [Megalobrama amblycephala]|uniref:uncharacterized protein LOC125244240 n=1 Tax=Megalobrama amblycephala TaxID=75352 RepID=UPI0020146CC5|nr:uncharacterized protein LOC125244240 [Megalobrama amblycephala]XP_048010271.1 uncharacterized protein LOC125244240 [Megalobrama amblycephala]